MEKEKKSSERTKRVSCRQTWLRAKRVAIRRAQVVDLDNDTLGPGEWGIVVVWVRLCGQCKAEATT